jgi:hypothetical protein
VVRETGRSSHAWGNPNLPTRSTAASLGLAARLKPCSAAEVNEDTINDWHERLNGIVQRYSARETGNGV